MCWSCVNQSQGRCPNALGHPRGDDTLILDSVSPSPRPTGKLRPVGTTTAPCCSVLPGSVPASDRSAPEGPLKVLGRCRVLVAAGTHSTNGRITPLMQAVSSTAPWHCSSGS